MHNLRRRRNLPKHHDSNKQAKNTCKVQERQLGTTRKIRSDSSRIKSTKNNNKTCQNKDKFSKRMEKKEDD